MSAIEEVLSQVEVAEPVSHGQLTMFPLVHVNGAAAPGYLTLGAAIAAGVATVTEISEGGSVPTLAVQNDGDLPVLLVDGEELVGARQNRIVNLTILAPAKRRLPIPVSCVERGRWSYRSRQFEDSPRAMPVSARARKTRDVSRAMCESGAHHADQGAVWEDVDRFASALGVSSPTSAMSDVFEARRSSIDEYVGAFACRRHQIGAVFAVGGRVVGADLFDAADTFRVYLPKLVRSYAVEAMARRAAPRVLPGGSARTFLDDVAKAPGGRFPAIGMGEDVRIESPRVAGAALVVDGRVVHLSAFRADDGYDAAPDTPEPRSQRRRMTFPLEIVNDHLLVRIDRRLALLDTGSTTSIGRGRSFTAGDHTWCPDSGMSFVLDSASRQLGVRLEWLLGHDFFARQRVLIDWPGRRLVLEPEGEETQGGTVHRLESLMHVPVIHAAHRGVPVRAVLDSGAALSYAPSAATAGAPELGAQRDFYPGVGEFETIVCEVALTLGELELPVRAGTLPPMLEARLGAIADGWILGSDFFRDAKVLIEYPAGRVVRMGA